MKRHLINGLISLFGEKRVFALALQWRRFLRLFGISKRRRVQEIGQAGRTLPIASPRPLIEALLEARSMPGSLDEQTLQAIYAACGARPSVEWIGMPNEGLQAFAMAMAGGAGGFRFRTGRAPLKGDLILLQSGFMLSEAEQATLPPKSRSMTLPGPSPHDVRRRRLSMLLDSGARLRVIIVNDVGFQYGAGVATRRQAQSFMLGGWDVGMVCWDAGTSAPYPALADIDASGRWLGALNLPDLHATFSMGDDEIARHVVDAVRELEPDVVLIGNIHGGNWPIDIISALNAEGFPTAAYMHDLHWVTGRCAYPGSCDAWQSRGCDANCPTAEQYPRLPRDQINAAWLKRAEVFGGPHGVPLLANSDWTRDFAKARFGDSVRVETLRLGLDENQFRPRDRADARALLGIDDDRPMVLLGSVNVKEERKGGPILAELLEKLSQRSDVGVLAFGHNSEDLRCTKAFGGVTDERKMALIYNAADILIGTAREEAFGQTIIEASASGLAVVAFKAGGTVEAMEPGVTGVAVETFTADAIIAAIDALIADPERLAAMRQAGRRRILREFTLKHQFEASRAMFERLWPSPAGDTPSGNP